MFYVSVPFGVLGSIWSYVGLHELSQRQIAKIDWWGNLLFAVGLAGLLAAITYGIQPYGGHTMGWTNPFAMTGLGGGVVLIGAVASLARGAKYVHVDEEHAPVATRKDHAVAA